jgi:predicted ATPase
MAFNFYLTAAAPTGDDVPSGPYIVLHPRSWNDYGFGTTFDMSLHYAGEVVHLGPTKIGKVGMVPEDWSRATNYTSLPTRFDALEEDFFSVGQDAELYRRLMRKVGRNAASTFLGGLRDLAMQEEPPPHVLEEPVTQLSLLRYVGRATVQDQYRRIIAGDGEPQRYSLEYILDPRREESARIDFIVDPEAAVPTNLHVLIGANGSGKTTALQRLRWAYDTSVPGSHDPAFLGSSSRQEISGLVSISFSAFDVFPKHDRSDRQQVDFRVTNVRLKPALEQADYFRELIDASLFDREFRLLHAAAFLAQADSVLARHGIDSVAGLQALDFEALSSGHKIVMLMLASVVRYCEEKTLVLVDEPESHLHPPLLGALARAFSWLMTDTNSLAIMATHSPIVLQEVPSRCAWKIWTVGDEAQVSRPTIQTLGENLGVLSREVFGVELDKSGYHGLLREIAHGHSTYADAASSINGEIGEEAKLILRSMMRTYQVSGS